MLLVEVVVLPKSEQHELLLGAGILGAGTRRYPRLYHGSKAVLDYGF